MRVVGCLKRRIKNKNIKDIVRNNKETEKLDQKMMRIGKEIL